jgi:hypothetical protein
MGVAFIDCPPERVDSLRAFFAENYWPEYILSHDEAFLKWQFGPTPASQSDHYHLILGLVDGAIKGCLGYIPVELSVGTGVRRAAWAANWMVDDSTRRLGLGPLLMRELSKRFDITLALGGNHDAHALLPRMGWTDFGQLSRYVCVLNRAETAVLAGEGNGHWPVHAGSDSRRTSGSTTQVDAFGADVTAFWDSRCGASAAGTRRSAEFLNWRYAAHPNFEHRLFEQRDGDRLRGIAVMRIEQVRDMPIRVAPLLDTVVEEARAADAAVVDFFCGSDRLDAPLRAAGFVGPEQLGAAPLPMLFQPLDRSRTGILFMAHLQKVPEAAGITDWYVTKSDGDQDRPS